MRGTDRSSRGLAVNCAIYTRKSSDEGLEQEFNSLDAQREVCEAYILSQKHAGWTVLPQMYDDGGLSGGTMERPALLRLLDDVRAGKVKVIVVYKVDRLTRSLSDFAKIVEVLDAHGASFVSVTQQFNTTTSMGRLTLNVLLSFAQFEREIAGERIRDKIAASKKKGMWMGGNVPLGYDAVERKLAINEAEAEKVRLIFARYAELGSVALLQGELDRAKIVSKQRQDRNGRWMGARRFSRGALYLMLQNPIYRGEIVHRDVTYPGLHEAIIDKPRWDAVQQRLSANRNNRLTAKGIAQPSLLAGRIFDAAGRPMTPSHAVKKAKRYRYYVSNVDTASGDKKSFDGQRIPAGDIEALVLDRLRTLFSSPCELTGLFEQVEFEATELSVALSNASDIVARLPTLPVAELRKLIDVIVKRIEVGVEAIRIFVSRRGLLCALDLDRGRELLSELPLDDLTVLEVICHLARVGKGMRIVIGDSAHRQPEVDHALTRLLGEAFRLRDELLSGCDDSIEAMSDRLSLAKGYLTTRIRLTYLAPDIIGAILDGKQPIGLSASRLIAVARDLPHDWAEQHAYLGFPAS